MHRQIAARIVGAAQLTPLEVAVEIGPGTGILTEALLARTTRVIGIEADTELVKILEARFKKEIAEGRLTLVSGDIRTFAIETLPENYAVVANIPYYLTGEILRRFLSAHNQPKSMTLLVQKEVAMRIVARSKNPSTHAQGKESLLSLSVKAYGVPKYEFTVPRGAFTPAPKVDSAVLTIRDISRKHFSTPKGEERFFTLIHAGFAHKRKKLGGNLREVGYSTPEKFASLRAEDLSLESWLSLSDA